MSGLRDAEAVLRLGYTDAGAVETLVAMGHRDAAKLWKAVKEKSMTTENEETTNGEDKPKRKPRTPKPTNGASAAPKDKKKARGRLKKKTSYIDMDIFLPRGRQARLTLPDDVDEADMTAMGEQLNAVMKLRELQNKVRGG